MARPCTISASKVAAQASTLAEVVAKNLLLEREVSRLRHHVSVLSKRELAARKRTAEVESLLEESERGRELAERRREEEVAVAEGRVAEATKEAGEKVAEAAEEVKWAGWLAGEEAKKAANAAIREAAEAAYAAIGEAEEELNVALDEKRVAEARALECEGRARRAEERVERLESWVGAKGLPGGKRGPLSLSDSSSLAGGDEVGEEGGLVGVPVAWGKVVVMESPASGGGSRKGRKKKGK